MNRTVCEVLNEELTISYSHYYHDYNIIIINVSESL